MSQENNVWDSRFGFIMVATGAAVGLGNIWKFPYMAGQNGGGVFILLYLTFLFLIGVPTMMAEMALGKIGRKNIVDTLRSITHEYRLLFPWSLIGYCGVFALLLVLGFYSAIAGWSIAYFFKTISGTVVNATDASVLAHWQSFLLNPKELMFWHTLYLMLTLAVVITGVNKGIEKLSNIAMPILFILLIALVGYAVTHGDYAQAKAFLLDFKIESLTPTVLITAMGQALFSLAVGAGAMLVYGAYVPDRMPLGSNLLIVAILNGLVAILAGFAIFPLVFAYGLSPTDGPELMFKVLPLTFNNMIAGQAVGALFFFLLFTAALTSSLSQAEPLVMMLTEKFNLKRLHSGIVVGVASWGIGVMALLSFNLWSDVTLLPGRNVFDSFAEIATDMILPLGALSFSFLAAWRIPKETMKSALVISTPTFLVWKTLVGIVTPLTLFWIYIVRAFG
jgi:NSS family neurotransmitter:Na+ symporter